MFERNIVNIWWHCWLIPIFHTYKFLHKYNAGRTITAVMTVCISCMSEEHTLQAKKKSPFYILSPKLVYSRTEEVYTKTIEGNICIKKMVIGQCDLHYSLCNILSMGWNGMYLQSLGIYVTFINWAWHNKRGLTWGTKSRLQLLCLPKDENIKRF